MAFHHVNTYTARKSHRCDSCEEEIPPGQEYTRIVEPGHNRRPSVVKLHLPGECKDPDPPKTYGKG